MDVFTGETPVNNARNGAPFMSAASYIGCDLRRPGGRNSLTPSVAQDAQTTAHDEDNRPRASRSVRIARRRGRLRNADKGSRTSRGHSEREMPPRGKNTVRMLSRLLNPATMQLTDFGCGSSRNFSALSLPIDKSNWCRFPRMKCVCAETSGYERLNENFLDYQTVSEDKDNATNEKEEEIVFYNDDGSFQTVIVERNLCASDLCQLLALKNRVSKSVNWSIVEHWQEYGLERFLEDHEYVLSASRDMRGYSRHAQYRYVFRKDYRKYEFFHDPQQFFPADMLNVTKDDFPLLTNVNENYLQNLVLQEGKSPVVFSQVWIKDQQKQAWGKAFLLLREKKLYLSYKIQVLAKFLRAAKIRETALAGSFVVFGIRDRSEEIEWIRKRIVPQKNSVFLGKTRIDSKPDLQILTGHG
ncbi:hypothetical protein MTP99_010179 [Tenebrio molitor]|nr:hypothetical protein MTP99_010179 [Tenebrio molitor]